MLRHGRGHVGGPIILRWRQTDDRPDGRTAEADALDQIFRDRLPELAAGAADNRDAARQGAGDRRRRQDGACVGVGRSDRVWTVRTALLSGLARKFVGGSGPGGGVAEVEPAGGVQGVFGGAGEDAGRQGGDFVAVFAGQVDREAPAGG